MCKKILSTIQRILQLGDNSGMCAGKNKLKQKISKRNVVSFLSVQFKNTNLNINMYSEVQGMYMLANNSKSKNNVINKFIHNVPFVH